MTAYCLIIRNGKLMTFCLIGSLGLTSNPSGPWTCSDCAKGEVINSFYVLSPSMSAILATDVFQTMNLSFVRFPPAVAVFTGKESVADKIQQRCFRRTMSVPVMSVMVVK